MRDRDPRAGRLLDLLDVRNAGLSRRVVYAASVAGGGTCRLSVAVARAIRRANCIGRLSDRPEGLAVGACVLTTDGAADAMTSHQPPSQPTPPAGTPATYPVEWIEQPNGDRIAVTPRPPAACKGCGVVYHADDMVFGRCDACNGIAT